MRAQELVPGQAVKLWGKFYAAHGPAVMENAYGWTSPKDRTVQPDEYVWAFHDPQPGGEKCIGWGSLRLDAMDGTIGRVALGVFPRFERHGYRHQILNWITKYAKRCGLEYLLTETYLSNGPQLARKFREAQTGPWKYCGTLTVPPPGYAVFARTLKENA